MNMMASNNPLIDHTYTISKLIGIDDHCKEILSKDTLKRTDYDIDVLLSNKLFIQLPFIKNTFLSQGYEILRAFLKTLKLIHLKPNEDIYRIGDSPKNSYVLLEGNLQVFISNPNYKPSTLKTAPLDLSTLSPTMESAKHINQGELFGEKELIIGSSRESTVIATTPVILGKVDKRAFLKMFDGSIRKFQQDYLKLFQSMKLFKKKDKGFIEPFLHEMSLMKFNPNEVIISKGEKCDMIYIIRTGRIRVIDNDDKTGMTNELLIYKPGQLIGDIEVYLKLDISLFTMICTDTKCEVLYCPRETFLRLLGNLRSKLACCTHSKLRRIKARQIECYRYHLVNGDINININTNTNTNENNDTNANQAQAAVVPKETLSQLTINIDGDDDTLSNASKVSSIFSAFRNKADKGELFRRHSSYTNMQTNNIMKYPRRDTKSITAVGKKMTQKNNFRTLRKIITVCPNTMRGSECCLKLSSFSTWKKPKITIDKNDSCENKIAAYGDKPYMTPLASQHLKESSTRLTSLQIGRRKVKYNTYNPRLTFNTNCGKENSTSYSNFMHEPIGQYEFRKDNSRHINEGIQIQLSRKSLQSPKLRQVCLSKLMYMNKEVIGSLLTQKYDFLRSHSQLTLLK